MAARSDAATDRVTLNSAPNMTAVSIGGWFQINSAAAASFNPCWRLSLASGDGTAWILSFRGTNGRTPTLYSPSNTTGIVAPEIALDTYIYLMATLSGTSAQLLYGTTPGSLSKVTGTVAASNTPDRFCVFGRSASDASEWLNGTASKLRAWEALLSDADAAAESAASAPVRSANAWANWGFSAAALTDTVAARTLTAGSTALSSANDPPFGSAPPPPRRRPTHQLVR